MQYKQTCHKFCPKFHVVCSWIQWSGRVQRLVIFGLLTLQVLVPRQFAHVSHSVNMEWCFKENHVAVNALHKCRKSDSQIFKPLKPLKISHNFVYRAINVIRNCGVLKTGFGYDAWKVWGLKPKQYRSGFAEIRSGNRSCPESWTYRPNQVVPHQGRSTPESAPPLKGTHPYCCYEGDPTNKSRASPLVAHWELAQKHPLHGQEIFHHQGAV